MASIKLLRIFLFLTLFGVVMSSQSKLIYRRYEKKHPKKNYVEIIEIFGTQKKPETEVESNKKLNDFLAKDAYKTDMNCTKSSDEETTTEPAAKPNSPWFPNLNDLFTISARSTKPTIKPNPKENNNPDYTNVMSWPKPNVQITKHSPNVNTPTMVIKESDDDLTKNEPAHHDIEETTEEITTTEFAYEDEIIYKSEEEKEDDEYNEENYPDVIPPDDFDQTDTNNGFETDDEYFDENENSSGEYDEELGKRCKRHKKMLTIRKRTHKSKSNI